MKNKIAKNSPAKTGWRNQHPVFVFIGLFTLVMLAFYCFYLPPYFQDKLITPLATYYAKLSGMALNIMGQQTTVFGDAISSPQFLISIKKGCDAAEPMALFVAGILAFPASFRKKFFGLLTGLCVIFVLNIVRIITLFLIGVYNPSLFDAMHVEVWQAIFILAAIAMWFLWLRWAVSNFRVS